MRESTYGWLLACRVLVRRMEIIIVGPGALGIVFAAKLAGGGHQVTLLGRPSPRLDQLRERGVRLQRKDSTIHRPALRVTDDPAIVADADAVVVLVKAGDTTAAMQRIAPFLRRDTPVLTLQNGLGNAQKIRDVLGPQARVLPGTTSQGATRLVPDLVVHAGEGPTLIGYETAEDAPVATELARTFTQAGISAASVPDIERWLWHKVAINAAINGLTALGGIPNGEIANDPALLDAAEAIAEEAAAVARAQGLELGSMRRAVRETALATAVNRSSMLQDLEAGRETEVDAIHSAIVEAASASGLAVPITATLAALIKVRSNAHRAKKAQE